MRVLTVGPATSEPAKSRWLNHELQVGGKSESIRARRSGGGAPRGGRSFRNGVTECSVLELSDKMRTAETSVTARVGLVATFNCGMGRAEIMGEAQARQTDGRGPPPRKKPYSTVALPARGLRWLLFRGLSEREHGSKTA